MNQLIDIKYEAVVGNLIIPGEMTINLETMESDDPTVECIYRLSKIYEGQDFHMMESKAWRDGEPYLPSERID